MTEQFQNLRASELYCTRCKTARPVREKLLLVLPGGELYDFRCVVCGESCGTREVKAPPPGLRPDPAPQPTRKPRRLH